MRCRQSDERFAGRRGSLREVAFVEVRRRRLAARGRALIRADVCVALDDANTVDCHTKLFGDELCLRRQDALAELAFARVGGHRAVCRDRNPRIELRWIDVRRACVELAVREAQRFQRARRAEADDERAAGLQEFPAPHDRFS